jgi:hypothetical protein
MDNYIIFNQSCIYDNEKTIIFMQTTQEIISINIYNTNTKKKYNINLIRCNTREHDYAIIIYNSKIDNIGITINNIIFDNMIIYYPFEDILYYISSYMNIISTFCKNYNNRLDEWIKYNINLGFDKIIIFNNEESKSHSLNEGNGFYEKMNVITDKYKDYVYVINFPYSSLNGYHYTTIQRMSLHISLTALHNKCNFCAYIDADEFIYMNNSNNIKMFLKNYNDTLEIGSNILTNKNDNDIIYNNILSLCNYIGENKYTKLLMYMKKIPNIEGSNDIIKFLPTPHERPFSIKMNKNIIMHFHCWVNQRYKYNESQKYISLI